MGRVNVSQKIPTILGEFIREPDRRITNRLVNYLTVILLWLIGAARWDTFFGHGRIPFTKFDWPKELDYLSTLKEALESGQIPYYFRVPHIGPDRFLAIPETLLSPQLLLLKFLSPGGFVLVNCLILYSLGFLGCLWIKNRYRLSPLAFAVLILIFNFNGHIVAHLAVGHIMWMGYFLLPFFVSGVLLLLDGRRSLGVSGQIALTLFAILLQGAVHLYIYCLVFLLLLCVSDRELLRPVVQTVALAICFSLVRLLPAALSFGQWHPGFLSGFPTILVFLQSLLSIQGPQTIAEGLPPLGWWELDIYMGILGAALVIWFGVVEPIRARAANRWRILYIPMAILLVLSFSDFYKHLYRSGLPFLDIDRVSSRFVVVPLTISIFLASIGLQQRLGRWGRHLNPWAFLLLFAGIYQLRKELFQHARVWSPSEPEAAAVFRTGILTTSPASGGLYTFGIRVGLAISLISLLGFLAYWVSLRRSTWKSSTDQNARSAG